MPIVVNPRLPSSNFRLPIEKIRAGYKSDTYFNRTKFILERDTHYPRVTMQLFQKVPNAVVCGVDHALAILSVGAGFYTEPEKAERLFQQYLKSEAKAYRFLADLSHIKWEQYQSVAQELFEISKLLNACWISCFEEMQLPVIAYGVGSAFFDRRGGKFEYTADVVEPFAKAGRELWRGPELHKVINYS